MSKATRMNQWHKNAFRDPLELDNRTTPHIQKMSVSAFLTLFEAIKKKAGNRKLAEAAIGVNSSAIDKMRQGVLTVATAKKIMQYHKKHC